VAEIVGFLSALAPFCCFVLEAMGATIDWSALVHL